jgi:hypothetical protein
MLSITLINTLVVVVIAVIIHYECLMRLNEWLPKAESLELIQNGCGVFGALMAHVVEVWCFARAYWPVGQFAGHPRWLAHGLRVLFLYHLYDHRFRRYLTSWRSQVPDRTTASADRSGADLLDRVISICRNAEVLENQITSLLMDAQARFLGFECHRDLDNATQVIYRLQL